MSILSIPTVGVPWNFRWISNINRIDLAIYSVQPSNSEGLSERQYCQYPQYLYPDISVETPIWTVVAFPSKQYSIIIQKALLNLIIVNIHFICTLKFRVKLQYDSNSEGLIER
jgi:hypothetical protein